MTESRTITIPSCLHGDRVWTCIGPSGRATFKGVPLDLWETPCVVCGSPFTRSATRPGSGAFDVTTCEEHRRQLPRLARVLNRALASWDIVTRLYRQRPRRVGLRRRYESAWDAAPPDRLKQLVETAIQYPHWTNRVIADLRRQTQRLDLLAAALKADPWICKDASRWAEWVRLDNGRDVGPAEADAMSWPPEACA